MTDTTSTPRSRRLSTATGLAAAVGLAAGLFTVGSPAQAENGAMIMPASGTITGTTKGYCRSGNEHGGFDIAAATGTPIYAAAPGTVTDVAYRSGDAGYRVKIDHGNGWETRYSHMNTWPSVKEGQRVGQGTYLGPVGSTGNSTGPHLHFAINKNGAKVTDASLVDDFVCGSRVSAKRTINYSFPGLSASTDVSSAYPKIRQGDSGTAVKNAQVLLTAAGHPVEQDGKFGSATLAAVKAFQSKVGTSADGVVGPKTWGALVTARATGEKLRTGSEGAQVKILQRGLNATLGEDLVVDGKFGSATTSAVKRYQSSRGLSVDGVVGPATWGALKGGR